MEMEEKIRLEAEKKKKDLEEQQVSPDQCNTVYLMNLPQLVHPDE